MSLYPLTPSPSFGAGEANLCMWKDAFSTAELNKIVEIGKSLRMSKATVGGYTTDQDYKHVRESKTSWIVPNDQTAWIFQKLGHVCNTLNGQNFKFDLWGFAEGLQFTEYDSEQKGHYDWHLDSGVSGVAPRKLSMVLQLSDPADYEGGKLQVRFGQDPRTVEKGKGLIAVFPSFVLHRVTPVTEGIRYSLVAWVSGPQLR